MNTDPKTDELELPPYYANLVDAVCEDDRAWFATNPHKDVRLRDIVPGEFWPIEYPANVKVVVRRLGPGTRSREVFA